MHSIITHLCNTSEFIKPLHVFRFTQSSQNPLWSLLWISPFYTRGCRKLNKVNALLRVTQLMTGTGPPAWNIVLSPLHPSCLRCGPKPLRRLMRIWETLWASPVGRWPWKSSWFYELKRSKLLVSGCAIKVSLPVSCSKQSLKWNWILPYLEDNLRKRLPLYKTSFISILLTVNPSVMPVVWFLFPPSFGSQDKDPQTIQTLSHTQLTQLCPLYCEKGSIWGQNSHPSIDRSNTMSCGLGGSRG